MRLTHTAPFGEPNRRDVTFQVIEHQVPPVLTYRMVQSYPHTRCIRVTAPGVSSLSPVNTSLPQQHVLRSPPVPRPPVHRVLGQEDSCPRPGPPPPDHVQLLRQARRGRVDLEDRRAPHRVGALRQAVRIPLPLLQESCGPSCDAVPGGDGPDQPRPAHWRHAAQDHQGQEDRRGIPLAAGAGHPGPGRALPPTVRRVPRRVDAGQGLARHRAPPVAADGHPDQPAGNLDPVDRSPGRRSRTHLRTARFHLPQPRPQRAAVGADRNERDRPADPFGCGDGSGPGRPPPQRRRQAHHPADGHRHLDTREGRSTGGQQLSGSTSRHG